ncbi:MAG: hypothetical protein GY757_35225 [bacterium]|nr:hypothetical protein [bacterium]
MKKGRGISLVEYVDRFPTLTALDSKESLAANPRKDATATRSTLLSQKVYRETFPTLTASMETMEDMEQARFPWGDRPNYQECKMWLTLVANDGRQVDPPSYWHKKTPYKHLGSEVNRAEGTKGRKLSALFAEYIMGYPPYYTDLEEPKPIPGFEKWLELAAVHGPWVQEWPGVSRTVDKQKHRGHRIRCLGNSLVPQIAQILFMRVKEILDAESK